MTADSSLKTIGWIVVLMVVIVVIVVIGFGVVGFALLFSGDDVTVTETTHIRPEYNLQKSERDTPTYINYNVDAAEEAIMDVCSEYKDSLVYMRGETDCNDMAIYLWNMLQKEGVKTLLVIGTPDGGHTPFAACDHAWLSCNTPDGYIYIEPTVPMVIYSNYVYTFRTSEEVDEYMIKTLEESKQDLIRYIREEYPHLTEEEIETTYEILSSSEKGQARLVALRSSARYIIRERPGDYSDFDYRQGYYYAKPSDLRKDIGERW